MTEREQRCETCRFWNLRRFSGYGPEPCKRHAPIVDPFASLNRNEGPQWPKTQSGDWCGDWEQRAPELPEDAL